MIGLYVDTEAYRDAVRTLETDDLWRVLRTFMVNPARYSSDAQALNAVEVMMLISVEHDFPDVDFAAEPLRAVRSSSGWSGEVRIGDRVVGHYQIRKDY